MKVYFSDPNLKTMSKAYDHRIAKHSLPDKANNRPARQNKTDDPDSERFTEANTDGYITWNFSPLLATESNCLEDGTIYLIRFTLPQKATNNGLGFYIKITGETDPDSNNQIGLFNAAGKQLRSQNVNEKLTAIGLCSIDWAQGPIVLAPGHYYVSILMHTTVPVHLASWPGKNISSYISRKQNTYPFAILCNLKQSSLPDSINLSEMLPSIVSIWSALY